ncbi:hypothetical protein P5706_27595 [Pseudomonas sp. ChxA]|uniref:hypothetical protein n=1 Tax=Pseudomonas TaxID=286 RepID=UPI001FD3852D|nr:MULTISPECIES: hypothetical protein [Pseudomonas]MDL2187952.1 hypothetical protein [Pseudomonas sp. ChxA]
MNTDIVSKQGPQTLRYYTRRFAFTVGMAVSMSLVSISGNLSHSLLYYARINYLPSEYAVVAALAMLLVLCIGMTLVAAGSRFGFALLVGVASLNALLAADYLGNHRVTMFAVFPLLQSLLGLFLLHTKNHRRYVSILRVKRRRKLSTTTAAL